MKSKIVLHKHPSAIERLFNKVIYNCETVYVVPEHKPAPDPYEGMSDAEIIAKLNEENRQLKYENHRLRRERNQSYTFGIASGCCLSNATHMMNSRK